MKGKNPFIRRITVSLLLICFLTALGIPPGIARAESLPESNIDRAVNWIVQNQNEDGSFGNNETLFLDTIEVSNYFNKNNIMLDNLTKSKNWIKNLNASNNDLIARALPLIMEGEQRNVMVNKLISSQNNDGGWGINNGFESDNLDTVLILKALMEEKNYTEQKYKAVQFLLTAQNVDGGWGFIKNNESSIFLTGFIRYILIDFSEKTGVMLTETLDKSGVWLKNNKNSEGSWETDKQLYNKYYVYLGLCKDNWQEVSDIPSTIISLQNTNGSFMDDPYITALMLDLLLKDKELAKAEITDMKLLVNGKETTEIDAKERLEIIPIFTGRNCIMEVSIHDKAGNKYDAQRLTEPAVGGITTVTNNSFYWGTNLTSSGEYIAEAVLKDESGQIKATFRKGFKITPFLKCNQAEVKVTPNASIKDSEVIPKIILQLNSESNILGDCIALINVVDSSNNQIFEKEIPVKIGQGNAVYDLNTFPVDNSIQNVYTVKVKLSYQDKIFLERKGNFRIIEQAGALYTTNSDFDRGIMTNLNHDEISDQLQLSKIDSGTSGSSGEGQYNSMIFSIDDIIFFSYEDNTELGLYDSNEKLIWQGKLNKGQHQRIRVEKGAYRAIGSKKFSVLSGDPILSAVVGYYAMDQNGYGTSNEIYSYVPDRILSNSKFVVTAYEDDTAVHVYNSNTGKEIWSGTLNKGKHWDTSQLSGVWVHITSNKPVSALTAYDQSYFVPSKERKWSGTEFYTYVGNVNSWPHDLTVISYSDNNSVVIKDTDTGETVWSGILNKGKAHVESYPKGSGKYFTITSSDTSTVCVQPWVSQTSGYHQGTYVADSSGSGLGTEFISTTVNRGYLYALAYKDNTTVNVYNSQTGVFVKSYNLNKGQYIDVNPGNGLWRVTSNNNISLYSGFGAYNAGFAPVEFGEVASSREGTWNVIHDGAEEDYEWSKILWHEQRPQGTNIEVMARSANSIEELSSVQYKQVINGESDGTLKGRFVQVEVKLTGSGSQSPILEDIYMGNGRDNLGLPVANAGEDQLLNMTSDEGTRVVLDGTKSYDPQGENLTYKWTWNGGEAEGAEPVISLQEGNTEITLVVSDGKDASTPDKVNITVVGNSSFKPNITTDKSDYNKDENVKISIKAENESPITKKYKLNLDVLDKDNNIVENLLRDMEVELSGGEQKDINKEWNVKATLADSYIIRAVWIEGDLLVGQNKVNVNIKPDGGVSNSLTTDKAEYTSNDTVNITEIIKNTSTNSVLKGIIVVTKALNPDGRELWSQSKDIEEIPQSGNMELKSSFDTQQMKPGSYTITSKTYMRDILISERTSSISIKSTADNLKGLRGDLSVVTRDIYPTNDAQFKYILTNDGNADLVDLNIRARIVDTKTQEVVGTFTEALNLEMNETKENTLTISHDILKAGNYLVVLDAVSKAGETISLGSGGLNVLKPYTTNIASVVRPRILVWAESQINIDFAEAVLTNMEVFHKVVKTPEEFMTELGTGKYNQYMLLDCKTPLNGEDDLVLADEIAKGKGLIATGDSLLDNFKTLGIFGAKFRGYAGPFGYSVDHLESSPFGALKLNGTGRVQVLELLQGEQLSKMSSQRGLTPGTILNQYQNGKAILFAFDLGSCVGENQAVLKRAVELTAPNNEADNKFSELEIRVNAKDSVSAGVKLCLPEGVELIWSQPSLAAENYTWRFNTEPEKEYILRTIVDLPESPGDYPIRTESYYDVSGQSIKFDTSEIKINRQ